MHEHNNDRLEEFFRKAVSRPDVPYNEEDWRRLEARLDALAGAGPAQQHRPWWAMANLSDAVALLIFVGIAFTAGTQQFFSGPERQPLAKTELREDTGAGSKEKNPAADEQGSEQAIQPIEEQATTQRKREAEQEEQPIAQREERTEQQEQARGEQEEQAVAETQSPERNDDAAPRESLLPSVPKVTQNEQGTPTKGAVNAEFPQLNVGQNDIEQRDIAQQNEGDALPPQEGNGRSMITRLGSHKLRQDGMGLATDHKENKQEAIVTLPGAGEEDNAVVQALDLEKESLIQGSPAAPRLSLLLIFAPDFSGTSFDYIRAPGHAFGGMLEYNLTNRWSVYGGAILNFKQYTGNGEDYSPPTGYWQYYTNGVVPSTIDGSCRVLELPLSVRYEIGSNDKSRWTTSLGTSSYLMRDEVYQYHFDQNNPGAHQEWRSDGTSRFFFSMVNVSIAYERYVLPGLALGVEPYLKMPLEGIGWSNVKLYSTGFSVTARYSFLNGRSGVPRYARSPD